MSKLLLSLLLIAAAGIAAAQEPSIDPTGQIQWNLATGTTAPTATCTQFGQYASFPYGAQWGQQYLNTTTNYSFICGNGGWTIVSGTGTFPGCTSSGAGSITCTGTAAAPFSQSVSCTNGNDSVDHDAVQALINQLEAKGATLNVPLDKHCNILPSYTNGVPTEALLVTGPMSLEGHGQLNFQMPAPSTASVTACSTANVGLVTTATITAANTFVANWGGSISGFSGGCSALNGMRFTVSATGLSMSGFQFIVPMYIVTPISASDTGTATANMAAIRRRPTSTANMYGVKWSDVTMQNVSAPDVTSTTLGGDMIVYDCSAGGALSHLRDDNLLLNRSPAGFNSQFMDNQTQPNGCVDHSDFNNMHIYSGQYWQKLGDGNLFRGAATWFNAYGDGFNAASLSGATGNVISGPTVEGSKSFIHLRGGLNWLISPRELAGDQMGPTSTAGILLDGADIYTNPLTDTVIENVAVIDQNYAIAVPNLQIDPTVLNTTIHNNFWTPQIISGVPFVGILHNGGILNIEGTQSYPTGGTGNDYSLYGGAGAYGSNPPITAAGGGKPIENEGLNSENPTTWSAPVTGAGSSVTVGAPVQIPGPKGNTITAYPVTMTMGANGTTGYSATLFYVSAIALPNPHGYVNKMYVLPTACPAATSYTFVYGSFQKKMTCGGTFNGWTLLQASNGNLASTSTAASIYITSTAASTYSTTMTFYVTYAQIAQQDGDYVKTTNQAVPLSYGTDPANFASADPYPIQAFNGIQDVSIATALGPCNFFTWRTDITVPGVGTNGSDVKYHCEETNALLGIYGWQVVYQIPALSENYLLQSNTWNVSPWSLTQTGTALAAVVTNAPAITDPFGHTGTVQEVVLDLNGDVTSGDHSTAMQSIAGLANPHTATISVWLQGKTGTPKIIYGNNQPGGTTAITLSSSWQKFPITGTFASTGDDFVMELVAGAFNSPSADFYVFASCVTYSGGACVSATGVPTTTTTAAIDNTANAPILCNPATGTAGQFCDPTQAWVTPAGGTGTVASFSAGNLSPLFTTSVATATTTPTLSFSLSNLTAHQFYGNNTGSTAAPTASLIGAADVSPNTYAVATGLVNVYAITLSPAPTALVAGLTVAFLPNLANTTSNPTLNVNGLGAKQIIKWVISSLTSFDLVTTSIATVIYDGTSWELQNPKGIIGSGQVVLQASPTLTGTPLAPTAAAGTNTTQLATTAFVAALGLSIPTGTPTYTAGTNVTSVACATSYTCTNTRGEVTIVGGTATTGTIATINFSATLGTTPGLCIVNQNGGGSLFDLGHGVPSTTSFTITAGVTVATATLNVDYYCVL